VIMDVLRRERGRLTISYDPNVRLARRGPVDAGVARVEAVVALADVVKVSAEDLAWLYPGADPAGVASRWAIHGPRLVVVTLGGDGSLAVTAGGVSVRRAAIPVEVVDTVGAGDAFTSGLLDALARADLLGTGHDRLAALDAAALAPILDHAGTVAALTCARPGADPPWAADLPA
jgi:fructokinase